MLLITAYKDKDLTLFPLLDCHLCHVLNLGLEQVQRVDGVILLDWSDRSLERQIQLGAKTGDIDINLARFEMSNYRSNIIPVAQFFDQQGRLHIVRLYYTFCNIFQSLVGRKNIHDFSTFHKNCLVKAVYISLSNPYRYLSREIWRIV